MAKTLNTAKTLLYREIPRDKPIRTDFLFDKVNLRLDVLVEGLRELEKEGEIFFPAKNKVKRLE